MATFDDFWSKAENLAKNAAAATRHAADSAKLSINIAAEEDKLKNAYAALGALCYPLLEAEVVPQGDAITQQMLQIRQQLSRLATLRAQKAAGTTQEQTDQTAAEPEANSEDFEEIKKLP